MSPLAWSVLSPMLVVLAAAWMVRGLWAGAGSGYAARRIGVDDAAVIAWKARGVGRFWAGRRQTDAALIAFAEAAARSVRSGASLVEAMSDAGRSAGPRLSADMVALRRRIDAGDSVSTAIERWSTERPSPGVHMIAATCRLGHELGGPVADGFDSIARALRSRRDVAAEARSLSSQARASAALLLALPVVVGTVMAVVDPATRRVLVGTPLGWGCVVGAAALDAVGLVWMRQLLRGGQ